MSKKQHENVERKICQLSIHNYPIVPEEAARHRGAAIPPLTRENLQTDFRVLMQFGGSDWSAPMWRQMFMELKMASVTNFAWYRSVEEAMRPGEGVERPFTPRKNWETQAEYYGRSGIYFYSNSYAGTEIPLEAFERLKASFGERFIGFNEGEWDGGYIGAVVSKGGLELSPKRSRREACEHYLRWLKTSYEKHQNTILSMSSLGFGCHYAGELGARILGLETGEYLPCDTVRMSFCRGACRQYDLLMNISPAVFSLKGAQCFKCYPKQEQKQSSLVDGFHLAGPEHGASLGLLKRMWWLAYMNGASILGLQCGYFQADATGEHEAQGSVPIDDPITDRKAMAEFTPIGWLQWEAANTARKYPMRGVPHAPVAVMLPFDHGWHPQPTRYHHKIFPQPYLHDFEDERELFVWGNIPYEAGDWQIDKFFRWVYPGSNVAFTRATRDERGVITSTPFGDSFDVILANADETAIGKYQAIVLLGDLRVDETEGLKDRLLEFVTSGGLLVVDVAQWNALPPESREIHASKSLRHYQLGRGRIVIARTPRWGAGDLDESVLNDIRSELGEILQSYNLIEHDGRPIYSLVNVTDQPDELIVTLCNHSQTMPWEGMLRIKGQDILEREEWLSFDETLIRDGALKCGVPANDVRIFKLKATKSFLNLKFSKIPWRKLGYGVPEWDEPVEDRFYGPHIVEAMKGRKDLSTGLNDDIMSVSDIRTSTASNP